MPVIRIPTSRIVDWDSFHDVFKELLGFPSFYGRNMSAWVDCLTTVDDHGSGMTSMTVDAGDVLTLQLDDIDSFARRCPEQYAAIIECTSFVNWRRLEVGSRSILALSFFKTPPL